MARIPDDFLVGTSSSAWQIEGNGGKGPGQKSWADIFYETDPSRWIGGDGPDRACDFYHRYKEDIRTMAGYGMRAFRFTIQWARFMEDPEKGIVSQDAVEYYRDVIRTIRESGMEPVVSLEHWDIPAVLFEKYNGWAGRETIALYEKYAEAVLEALGESYQAVWGVKPAVTSQQPAGKQQVIAYIERPFDTNIVCLHSYLGTAFSARVPRESRDPYRLFMDALELKPPPSLRHAYLQNPYAVTLWLLLRRAGFEDINIMRRFLHGQSFLGFELRGFYLDKEQGYVRLRDQRKDFMLQDKLEVCSWLREERGEATAARVILATFPGFGLWQGWRRWPAANAARMQADTLHYLRRGERMLLEEETRQEFLRHGLTGHVHDMCVQDMNHMNYSSRYPCKAITYPLEAQGWSCMVDGVYFALPQDTDELIELGKKFHNCVASYYGRVLKGASIIVGAMFRDQATICIEVVDREIVQAFGPCNMCLNGLRIRVLQDWADKCGLCMNKARLLG